MTFALEHVCHRPAKHVATFHWMSFVTGLMCVAPLEKADVTYLCAPTSALRLLFLCSCHTPDLYLHGC